MPKIRVKKLQTAQGIVEFALVLPILLLIIFGIFAFGHLFFAYSSVVSASREAARWGSAVGVADSLRPRYADCDSIRAAAVRVGGFAGVEAVDSPDENSSGIAISFDHGPNDVDPDYDDCTDDLGPIDVAYGDRINVRVTVLYNPIVPLVPIPSFPLTATTSRTIIKSLPVGEAPTAEPACPSTSIILEFLPIPMPATVPPWPQVNQPVDVRARVVASDGTSPTGLVDITIDDPDDINDDFACQVSATAATPGQACGITDFAFETAGTKYATARYDPQGACFQPSELLDEPLEVVPGDTTVEITSDREDPSWEYEPILVTFRVVPAYPAGRVPTGRVNVSDQNGNECNMVSIINGAGSCWLDPGPNQTVDLIAWYDGDANFNASPVSNPELHTIMSAATVTPTPTDEPFKPTITPTPTRTATPFICPYLAGSVHFHVSRAIQFEISNSNGGDVNVNSIDLTWPTTNGVQLREVRFSPNNRINNNCSATGPCLWQAPSGLTGLNPPSQTLNSGVSNWYSQAAPLAAGATKLMRYVFNGTPPYGDYFFTIRFDNGCVVEVPATR